MRALLVIGAVLVLGGALFAGRIVLHSSGDHGQLDIFHLVVTAICLALAAFLARRAVLYRTAA